MQYYPTTPKTRGLFDRIYERCDGESELEIASGCRDIALMPLDTALARVGVGATVDTPSTLNADGGPSDDALLDAYSTSVISAVARVAPAVVHLRIEGAGRGRATRSEGSGSGFIIAPDGYLLTNSHVAGGARNVEVTLSDGRVVSADIVGDDPDSDLAVLKVAA